MNLGFLLFDYFPFGGLQRDCLRIARLCAGRGHGVTLFTRTWQGELPADVRVVTLDRRGWSNISRNRHFLRALGETLPRHNLDGVVGFNRLPGLDVYYGADPCYVAKVERLKPRWYRWLPRFRHFAALEAAVFGAGSKCEVLMISPAEMQVYAATYPCADRLHLLPPGIVRREVTPGDHAAARARVAREFGWPADEKWLLFVGSGFRTKGLDRAIKGLAALPRGSTRLIVIGQNKPERFGLQARQLGVGERVHFLGGRHDVPEFLSAADLLVHPAYSENTGTVLLEALAAGLPVLTTETCGYAFHVEAARGGRVMPSPFDQQAFERTLASMLTGEERTQWRANALEYAAREDLYSCHERAADIILQTVAKRGPHAVAVGGVS